MSDIYNLYASIKEHEKVCKGFHITGKVTNGVVFGACSRCGKVVERPKSAPVIKDDTPSRIAGWEGKFTNVPD
jgi:hypothetical protein